MPFAGRRPSDRDRVPFSRALFFPDPCRATLIPARISRNPDFVHLRHLRYLTVAVLRNLDRIEPTPARPLRCCFREGSVGAHCFACAFHTLRRGKRGGCVKERGRACRRVRRFRCRRGTTSAGRTCRLRSAVSPILGDDDEEPGCRTLQFSTRSRAAAASRAEGGAVPGKGGRASTSLPDSRRIASPGRCVGNRSKRQTGSPVMCGAEDFFSLVFFGAGRDPGRNTALAKGKRLPFASPHKPPKMAFLREGESRSRRLRRRKIPYRNSS